MLAQNFRHLGFSFPGTEKIGGGGWTRTNDLGIMSPSREIEGEEDKRLSSAKSTEILQNPQQISNKK